MIGNLICYSKYKVVEAYLSLGVAQYCDNR